MKTLKIDCDWCPLIEWVEAYVEMVRGVLGENLKRIKIKMSRRGFLHFIITLNEDVDDMTACRLQFLLGDDRHRCKFNYARVVCGMQGWNKLFVSSSFNCPLINLSILVVQLVVQLVGQLLSLVVFHYHKNLSLNSFI